MKLYLFFPYLFLFSSICLNLEIPTSESEISYASRELLSTFKLMTQINSHEKENIHYSIDLLLNLTNKLADSSNKTCIE